MSDTRQCPRCSRIDAIPGTALDAAHKCPHKFKCDENLHNRCVQCWEASSLRRALFEERRATLVSQAKATLPSGRKVLMAERSGIPSGVAAGPVGVMRRGGS